MAITYDNFRDQFVGSEPATSLTYSFTTSGSDRGILVAVQLQNSATNTISGVTYAGVSMTLVDAQKNGASNEFVILYYLANPTVGANNVVVSASSSYMYAFTVSYTGVHQASMLNVSAKNQAGPVTTISTTPTTTVDSCWAVSFVRNNAGNVTDSTNFIGRGADGSFSFGDSNASVGAAGSKTVTAGGPSGGMAVVTAMIAPSAASSAVKTAEGLAIASVKTGLGLATASIKTWEGLA